MTALTESKQALKTKIIIAVPTTVNLKSLGSSLTNLFIKNRWN